VSELLAYMSCGCARSSIALKSFAFKFLNKKIFYFLVSTIDIYNVNDANEKFEARIPSEGA
jgi:hypothetical protein